MRSLEVTWLKLINMCLFQIMFSQAVRNRKGKLYKWMVDELLKQDVPTALSYCFDQIICLVI